MIIIDMWYNDEPAAADKVSIDFYPNNGEYRGNIYKSGRTIGDFTSPDSLSIEKAFPQLTFIW